MSVSVSDLKKIEDIERRLQVVSEEIEEMRAKINKMLEKLSQVEREG